MNKEHTSTIDVHEFVVQSRSERRILVSRHLLVKAQLSISADGIHLELLRLAGLPSSQTQREGVCSRKVQAKRKLLQSMPLAVLAYQRLERMVREQS